jgi:cytochrome c-type biogenesis protein CcmH/NrfF
MKIRMFALILPLFALVFIISSCASATSSPAPASTASITPLDGATLLQERCTVCHPLSFVEKSKHTAADWKLIVGMMISRGAKLSSDEETSVVNYLSANFGQ